MKFDGKKILKGVAKFVGSMGVGTLVTIGFKQNVIPKKLYEKIMIGIGSFVIADMVSMKAEKHIEDQIDEVFDFVDQLKGEPVKEIPHIDFSSKEVGEKIEAIQENVDKIIVEEQ